MLNISAAITRHCNHGFTVVELVVVIILLAILSTVALSRTVSTSAFSPATVTHQIQQEIRYAQATAMVRQDTQISWQLDLNGDNWRLLTTSVADGVLRDVEVPTENTDVQLTSGGTVEHLGDGGTLLVQFSSLGDLATLSLEGTGVAVDDGLLLEIIGDSTRTLCLYPTGYSANGTC